MKISFILNSTLISTLLLTPNIGFANSDNKYPASSFQPKVIYLDKEAAIKSSSTPSFGKKSSYDPKYPAANFTPKVIYP